VKNAMYMACERNAMNGIVTGTRKFLFEILPDLFPFGFYTDLEDQIWSLFLKEQADRVDSAD
jgi:hypothetical protein